MRLWTAVVAALIPGASYAHCDILGYNQTEPQPLTDEISNFGFDFDWYSDLDVDDETGIVRNYIFNNGDVPLSAIWMKAGIRIPLVPGLAPGAPFCNSKRGFASAAVHDFEAPITYGAAANSGNAAVYAFDTEETVENSFSEIEFAYGDKGENSAYVSISTTPSKGEGVLVEVLAQPADLTISFETANSDFGEAYGEVASALKAEGGEAYYTSFSEFAKFDEWVSANDENLAHQKAIFLTGNGKYSFFLKSDNLVPVSASIAILDAERQLLATGEAWMFVPGR